MIIGTLFRIGGTVRLQRLREIFDDYKMVDKTVFKDMTKLLNSCYIFQGANRYSEQYDFKCTL